MITVVTRWEDGWFEPIVEWRMWKQLKGSMKIDRFVFVASKLSLVDSLSNVEQYDTMDEALENVQGNRVFLEPTGYNNMYNLPSRDEDVVFILSNAGCNNMQYANVSETFKIFTPQSADMFGMQAAAIALAYWHGQ